MKWTLPLLSLFFVSVRGSELRAEEIDSGKYVPSILPHEKSDEWQGNISDGIVDITPDDPQLGSYDALSLDTRGNNNKVAFFTRSIVGSTSDTITVTAKLRLDAYSGSTTVGGCAINVENDRDVETLLIRPTGLRLYFRGVQYNMNTMDGYHEYTIVAGGNAIKVYVDGGVTPVISSTYGKQRRVARSQIGFGDGSLSASSLSSWAYVRYTVTSP
jgi:hypothetical protein